MLARALLGTHLVTELKGVRTVGRITETEAYWAPEDRASHAFGNRRTKRTEVMYRQGGCAYVYLIYGLHELFNVVTGPPGQAHAVLIRALEPVEGVEHMLARRGHTEVGPQLCAGPGVLTKAMGISRLHNGQWLTDPEAVWLMAGNRDVRSDDVIATPRIGIDYAGPIWAAKPWRFFLATSRFVSKPARKPPSA